MWIYLVVIGVFVVWAVGATVVAVARDGYRQAPTYEFEGKRNRFGRASVEE